MRALSAIAVLCALTVSSQAAAPSKPGNYDQTITVDGTERQYILHIPKAYDGTKAMPLLFMLHGLGGSAAKMQTNTGFDALADKEGFIVVYPQGTDPGPGWNSGLNPDSGYTNDDVLFFRKLVEKLKKQLSIKAKRIYVTGFSMGGFMCHRLAAELPDVFAAAACVAGTVGRSTDGGATWAEMPTPKAPVSIMIMHGQKDETVFYDGGSGDKTFKPFDDTRKFWKTANACSGKPAKTTSDNGNIINQTFSTSVCKSGKTVVAVTIVSGTHQWPKLDNDAKYDGTKRVWKFLSSKTLGGP